MSKSLFFLPVVVTMLISQCAPAAAQNHNNYGAQTGNTGVLLNNSSDGNTISNAVTGPSTSTSHGGAGGAGGSVTGGSANGASISFDARKREAASAVASPPTVVGTDSCLIPWGAAGQSTVFGLSLGGAQEDATCRRIKLAREYVALGWTQAAAAMYCFAGTESIVAMRSQGIDCRLLTGGSVTDAAFNGVPPIGQDLCWRAQDDAILWGELRRKGMCQ